MKSSNSTKRLRQFGLLMAAFFGLGLGVWPWVRSGTFRPIPLGVGAVFAVAALAYPRALEPIYKAWMKLGGILGAINSRIILGAVYFILFVPLAIFFRLVKRDPLDRKFVPGEASYRLTRTDAALLGSKMDKPF